jgi:hypothetical protein
MKIFYALLIAALFTVACNKKKDDPAKAAPAKTDPAAKPTEAPKAEPATPDPAKAEPDKAEPAAAAAGDVDQAVARALEFSDKLAKVVTEAGEDCAKIGAALKGIQAEAKTVASAEKALAGDPEKKKAYDEKYQKPAEEKLKGPMKQVERCMENADVKAFIEALLSA